MQEKRMESLRSIACAGSMGIISADTGTPDISTAKIKKFFYFRYVKGRFLFLWGRQ